jgi:hypothetical protein
MAMNFGAGEIAVNFIAGHKGNLGVLNMNGR